MKLELVTAVILRDDHLKDGLFHGHLVALYSDGTVWEKTEFTDRDGLITYSKGRRSMTLATLSEEFKKDLSGMGQRFRNMWFNRGEGYEIVSPVMMEMLKSFVVDSKPVSKNKKRRH